MLARAPLCRWFAAAGLALLLAIPPARAAMDHGRPACDYCRMILSDKRFGGRVQTVRGTWQLYDSIECLAAAVLTDSLPPARIRRVELWRYDAPGVPVLLSGATLVQCPAVESPMGVSLLAFASPAAARNACAPPLRLLGWREALEVVNTRWFEGKLDPASHAVLPGSRRAR